jgi:YVTN family beta-propeller protein
MKIGAAIARVAVPGAPVGIGTGFGSLWVATAQDNGGALARVDPATNQVLATVPVGGFPVGIAAGFGSMWQANHTDGTLTRVDPATNKVIATIPVGPGPAEVAVDGGRVWVGDTDSTLAAVDPATNRRIHVVRVGPGDEFRTLVAGAGSIWTDNTGGGISRVDSASGKNQATIKIPGCCQGGLLFFQGVLWASNIPDGRLYRINPNTNRVIDHVQIGQVPNRIIIAGGRLWVAHSDTSVVSWHAIDTARQLGSVTLSGTGMVATMAVTDATSIWVPLLDSDAVTRLATG